MRAMSLLGRCFTARGMLDLAAKTLSDAATELVVMDSVKKDVIYNLGLVYEKMEDKEKSIDCMKQIYEVDYGYRDVAARVTKDRTELTFSRIHRLRLAIANPRPAPYKNDLILQNLCTNLSSSATAKAPGTKKTASPVGTMWNSATKAAPKPRPPANS
jgi:hypothetical protein